MNPRAITFRCTEVQFRRLEQAMKKQKSDNRTAFVLNALREFLDFADREDVKKLDLFDLVERVDALDAGHPFRAEV